MEGTARKKARKEKSDVSEVSNDAAQSGEDTLDPSTYLTYDILRIVFQYLNGRNLASAAMVCRYNVPNPLIIHVRFDLKHLFNANRMTVVSVVLYLNEHGKI